MAKAKKTLTELEKIERRIERIKRKIKKERENLVVSGWDEESWEFLRLFHEIQIGHMRDLLPLAVIRHRIFPYVGEEKKGLDNWIFRVFDGGTLDDPPRECQ